MWHFALNHIYFCNLKNILQNEPLKVNVNRCIRSLKIIENEDYLLVAGNQEICIINIDKKLILLSLKFGIKCEFNCIFQRKNGNILKKKWKYFNY